MASILAGLGSNLLTGGGQILSGALMPIVTRGIESGANWLGDQIQNVFGRVGKTVSRWTGTDTFNKELSKAGRQISEVLPRRITVQDGQSIGDVFKKGLHDTYNRAMGIEQMDSAGDENIEKGGVLQAANTIGSLMRGAGAEALRNASTNLSNAVADRFST